MANDMIEKLIEIMKENILQVFNQIREEVNVHEHDFSLRSTRLEVSLDDDFEYIISPRFKSLVNTPLTNLRQENNLCISSLGKRITSVYLHALAFT